MGTRSGKTLLSWISSAGMSLAQCVFDNVFHDTIKHPTKEDWDRALFILRANLSQVDGIVACGRIARKAVETLNTSIPTIFIEHPSGLNRNLNDPSSVLKCISSIRSLYESLHHRGHLDFKLQAISEDLRQRDEDGSRPA